MYLFIVLVSGDPSQRKASLALKIPEADTRSPRVCPRTVRITRFAA